jgi:hypothetical protein
VEREANSRQRWLPALAERGRQHSLVSEDTHRQIALCQWNNDVILRVIDDLTVWRDGR